MADEMPDPTLRNVLELGGLPVRHLRKGFSAGRVRRRVVVALGPCCPSQRSPPPPPHPHMLCQC
eukprot:41017-Chlamydomonas_euryale.AAC.1